MTEIQLLWIKMDESLENCDVSDIAKRTSVSEDIEYCAGDISCTTNTLNRDNELTTIVASDSLSDDFSHDLSESSREDSNNDKTNGTERDTALKIINVQADVEGSSEGDETDTCTFDIPINDDNIPSVPKSSSNDSNLSIIPKQNYCYGKLTMPLCKHWVENPLHIDVQ